MKLTKQLKINIFKVLADYKIKINNPSFIAILKFAEEYGGVIDSSLLQKELLYPMSKQACENILTRLNTSGYFTFNKQDRIELRSWDTMRSQEYKYTLTELGYKSVKTESYYEDRTGILQIYVAEENEFIPQRIVKIIELPYDDTRDEKKPQKINGEVRALQRETIFSLKNNFIIDDIKEQIKILDSEKEQLIFNVEDKNSIISILNYSNVNKQYSTKNIKDLLLKNEFKELYENNIVKVDLNKDNLTLMRNIPIKNPIISNTFFDQITLNNIKVSPKSIGDAEDWFTILIKQQINQYFLNDKDFSQFSNSIADKFELYKSGLRNSISRKEFITYLDDEKDFYKKAKLTTIDYLNY